MSKIGVTLPAFALMSLVSANYYAPRRYNPKTYSPAPDPHNPHSAMRDTLTNLAQFFNPATFFPGASGCVGVSQTFTTSGTFTAGCTGTLTMEAWGGGGLSLASGSRPGAGGGAFASSQIGVTLGQVWHVHADSGGSYGAICLYSADAYHCSGAPCITSGGLNATNDVCAQPGGNSIGGASSTSVGTTKFSGGNGGAGIISKCGGGGGGSAGPGGAGKNGYAFTGSGSCGSYTATGGAGDNGAGGAGGGESPGVGFRGSSGANNSLGGGGGGGSPGSQYGGYGGTPGGGQGGTVNKSGGQVGGAVVIVHSMLDPATENAARGYSPGNVGTVSMS